jgi:hypothetical protein
MTLTLAPDLQADKRRASRVIAAASVLAFVLLAPPTSASAQSRLYETNNLGNPASIEGSWIFKIDVSLAQQPVGTFNSLISFAAGGIVVTTPSVPPLSISYGGWKQTTADSFNTVLYNFAPDSNGNGVVLLRLNLRLHLTGRNDLAGTGGRSTCDLRGENCVDDPVVFQFTGKRVVVTD